VPDAVVRDPRVRDAFAGTRRAFVAMSAGRIAIPTGRMSEMLDADARAIGAAGRATSAGRVEMRAASLAPATGSRAGPGTGRGNGAGMAAIGNATVASAASATFFITGFITGFIKGFLPGFADAANGTRTPEWFGG
jgi:hypothetical protein